MKNAIHQIDSKNTWLLPSARFPVKVGLVFVLTLENAYYFQNSPPFERLACFYVTISGNFEHFQYLNFETDYLENENLFQNTGVPFFS